jgi:hypothetical protein
VYSQCSRARDSQTMHCSRQEMKGVGLPKLPTAAPRFNVAYSDGSQVSGQLRPILAAFSPDSNGIMVLESEIGVVSAMTHRHSWRSDDWEVVDGVWGLGLPNSGNAGLLVSLLRQHADVVHFQFREKETASDVTSTMTFQVGGSSDTHCGPVVKPNDPATDVHWRVLVNKIRVVQTIMTANMTMVRHESTLLQHMPVLFDTGASHVFGSKDVEEAIPWLKYSVGAGSRDAVIITRMFVWFHGFLKEVDIELVNDAPRLTLRRSNASSIESVFQWVGVGYWFLSLRIPCD